MATEKPFSVSRMQGFRVITRYVREELVEGALQKILCARQRSGELVGDPVSRHGQRYDSPAKLQRKIESCEKVFRVVQTARSSCQRAAKWEGSCRANFQESPCSSSTLERSSWRSCHSADRRHESLAACEGKLSREEAI